MKQPTLKEVKKHFKKALMVESPVGSFDGKIKIKSIRWYDKEKEKYIACDCDNSVGIITLWGYDTGYSKILTYKEKTFSITESQIKDFYKITEIHSAQKYIEKLFPETVESEVKLETGKWYKSCINTLVFYSGNEENYGFSCSGDWGNKIILKSEWDKCAQGIWTEATEQEVFEALKNEAVKRGFVEGVVFNIINGEREPIHIKNNARYGFDPYGNKLLMNGWCIFEHGKWSIPFESITLSEAEQKLGKKIIV